MGPIRCIKNLDSTLDQVCWQCMESGHDQSDKLSVLDGDVEVYMSVFQLLGIVLTDNVQ